MDDDELVGRLLRANLHRPGQLDVTVVQSAEAALEAIHGRPPDALLADVNMPGMTGIELVRAVRAFDASLPVLLMSAEASIGMAVEGIRAGATDFLPKPVNVQAVQALVERAVAERPVREAVAEQRARATSPSSLIAGDHPRLDAVRRFAEQIAEVPYARVLITGESGTGKSLLARAIHDLGGAVGRFMDVNCAALPPNLLETELFGHEKGAFTDARETRRGLIELADRGTLFLDEIGALPLELQGKFLTFLDGRPFRRVGGSQEIRVETRVVAATNEDLRRRVRDRTFREDLFYRLDIAAIEVPPLRAMPGIVPELARTFAAEIAVDIGRPAPELDPGCIDALCAHLWPGNVRELRNAIERALIFHRAGPLSIPVPALTEHGADGTAGAAGSASAAGATVGSGDGVVLPHGLPLDQVERRYLKATLDAMEGAPLADVAGRLGIARKTLWEKRRKYDV